MASTVGTTTVAESGTVNIVRRILKTHRDVFVIWGILVAIIVFASLASDRFLTPFNLQRVTAQMTTLALVSVGQTCVLLTAGIDLSVGSIVSLVGTLMVAIVNHLPRLLGISIDTPVLLALGVIAGLLAGTLVGGLNGFVITRFHISPFMATLATLSIFEGLALLISQNLSGTLPREFAPYFTGDIGPIPVPLIWIVSSLVIIALMLRHTPFGRHVYAVGSNEHATRLSGMATDSIKLTAYMISGFLAGFAGIYTSARTLSGEPMVGEAIPFEAITAVVLGGVSLFGGRGSIFGTIAGVLIIAILSNMLNLLRISSDYQYILRGTLLVVAVAIYSRRTGQSVS